MPRFGVLSKAPTQERNGTPGRWHRRVVNLPIGQDAPDFDVVASDGRAVRLSELRGKKNVVLYFYPADFTMVCTREACGFREAYPDLVQRDTEVIGVSSDSNASHNRFAETHRVPFPLIADESRALSDKYDAKSFIHALFGRAKRVTYVIDKAGKIAGVFEGELNAASHVEGARNLVGRLDEVGLAARVQASEAARRDASPPVEDVGKSLPSPNG